MKAFLAFTKKEFCESSRTYKIFLLLIIFGALGFLNPISAKFLPELVQNFMPEGMEISLTEPVLLDSWMQFFKNTPQIGLIVMVIIFSGTMANEMAKGTLIHMLTKGLKRGTVVWSKFCVASLLWTMGYGFSFLITFFYSLCFWSYEAVPNLLFSAACVWCFGIFLIAAVILGGVLFSGVSGGLLFTGGIVVGLFILNMLQSISSLNPVRLISENVSLLTQELDPSKMYPPFFLTLALAAVLLWISVLAFNKKQL